MLATGEDKGHLFLTYGNFEFREQFLENPATYALPVTIWSQKTYVLFLKLVKEGNWSREKWQLKARQCLPFLGVGSSGGLARR